MGLSLIGMLISAVCDYEGEELLNLLMVDDRYQQEQVIPSQNRCIRINIINVIFIFKYF